MKKIASSLAVLLLSLGHHSLAGESVAIPGVVGPVTIALTTQYDVGGFTNTKPKSIGKMSDTSYEKILTNTTTLYKEGYSSVVKTGKYTNAEFIADLVASEQLASPASQWKLVYVSIPTQEIEGVFAVNRDGSSAVYLGGYYVNGGLPFNIRYNNGSAYNESDVTTYTRANAFSEPLTYNYKGSYTGMDTVSITLNTYSYAYLTALSTSAQSYSRSTDYVHDTSTSTTTVGATAFTNVIGDDDDNYGVIYTGSISFARLNSYPDTTVFVTAYNNYNAP